MKSSQQHQINNTATARGLQQAPAVKLATGTEVDNVLRYARANTDYSAAATAVLCDAIQMRDVQQVGVISYYYTRYCSIGLLSLNDNSSSSRV
eukprot:8418-Heterococcus_DN1.PRE.1